MWKELIKETLVVYKGLTSSLSMIGVLTKTIVATKERLEGGGGEREGGEGGLEAITPAQRRREIEAVRKEVCSSAL